MSTEIEFDSFYQIRVKGHLDSSWSEWFNGLTVTTEDNGDMVLSGPVVDQAALYGVLTRLRDLGLPLLSVTRVEPDLEKVLVRPASDCQAKPEPHDG